VGHTDTYVAQLQQAGLIRTDIPVPVITYLLTSLKMGIISAPELVGQKNMPPLEQLAVALSDLLRRWLEPEQLPSDTPAGKQALGEWIEHFNNMEGERERYAYDEHRPELCPVGPRHDGRRRPVL
jgi:hypothetical protein